MSITQIISWPFRMVGRAFLALGRVLSSPFRS
jgi:hypothetical protein